MVLGTGPRVCSLGFAWTGLVVLGPLWLGVTPSHGLRRGFWMEGPSMDEGPGTANRLRVGANHNSPGATACQGRLRVGANDNSPGASACQGMSIRSFGGGGALRMVGTGAVVRTCAGVIVSVAAHHFTGMPLQRSAVAGDRLQGQRQSRDTEQNKRKDDGQRDRHVAYPFTVSRSRRT